MLGVSVHRYYYLISISLLFSVLFSLLLSAHFSFIRKEAQRGRSVQPVQIRTLGKEEVS